jgi:hypothetical protein
MLTGQECILKFLQLWCEVSGFTSILKQMPSEYPHPAFNCMLVVQLFYGTSVHSGITKLETAQFSFYTALKNL